MLDDLTDTVLGLPVHSLVVHAAIVLVPLCAVVVLLMLVRPAARTGLLGWGTALLVTGAAATTVLARLSGPKLEARVDAGGVVAEQIERHRDFGELAIWPVLAFWLLTVALVVASRGPVPVREPRGPVRADAGQGTTALVLAVLAAVAGVVATVAIVLTGHTGTEAVWKCTITPSACSGG